MRRAFHQYYPPTPEEMDAIWSNAHIVLDTNALLNMFRYGAEARDQFLRVLESYKASLWLPHQVGLEFHSNRPVIVAGSMSKPFASVDTATEKARAEMLKGLNDLNHHPALDKKVLIGEADSLFDAFKARIAKLKEDYNATLPATTAETLTRISDLYEGRIGGAFTDTELEEIFAEGKVRYEKSVPPGFKDQGDKEGNAIYGDLVLWKEMLRLGEKTKRPMLFITDDAKEDWWSRPSGQNYGARVELIEEYWSVAQARVHFYAPNQFLKFAGERNETEVSKTSLDEVREVSSNEQTVKRLLAQKNMLLKEKKRTVMRLRDRDIHEVAERYANPAEGELAMAEAEYTRALQYINSLEDEIATLQANAEVETDAGQRESYIRLASNTKANLRDMRAVLEDLSNRRNRLRVDRHVSLRHGGRDSGSEDERLQEIDHHIAALDNALNNFREGYSTAALDV